ncbi:MAG: hypothetical protein ACJ8H8_02645 [Geminicoccaceae bacterium]
MLARHERVVANIVGGGATGIPGDENGRGFGDSKVAIDDNATELVLLARNLLSKGTRTHSGSPTTGHGSLRSGGHDGIDLLDEGGSFDAARCRITDASIRAVLASHTLADLAAHVDSKAPPGAYHPISENGSAPDPRVCPPSSSSIPLISSGRSRSSSNEKPLARPTAFIPAAGRQGLHANPEIAGMAESLFRQEGRVARPPVNVWIRHEADLSLETIRPA